MTDQLSDSPEAPGMTGIPPSRRRPADPARHAVETAREWEDVAESYVRRRMRELGIPEERIGAVEHARGGIRRAFDPDGRNGGSCDDYGRLYVDSGFLNPDLLAGLGGEADAKWRELRGRDRIDAILPHEDVESRTESHEEALRLAPNTEMPISHEAREMLRAMDRVSRGR